MIYQLPTVTFTQAITAASIFVTGYLLVDSWLIQRRINKVLCGIVKATERKAAMEASRSSDQSHPDYFSAPAADRSAEKADYPS